MKNIMETVSYATKGNNLIIQGAIAVRDRYSSSKVAMGWGTSISPLISLIIPNLSQETARNVEQHMVNRLVVAHDVT